MPEIDFLNVPDQFLEVKAGAANPVEFAWFNKVLPKTHFTVLSRSPYRTHQPTGIAPEDILLRPREEWMARASSPSAS